MIEQSANTDYSVHLVEGERPPRWRRGLRKAVQVMAVADFWVEIFTGTELKQECVVVVCRESDGIEVARYDYDHLESAMLHVESLNERLKSMTISEFERDLQISH